MPRPKQRKIAGRFQKARMLARMTVACAAAESGLTYNDILVVETARKMASDHVTVMLAEVYGVDPNWLLCDQEDGPEIGSAAVEPTSHLPGTQEKMDVLGDRAALGLPLFHPLDAKLDADRSLVVRKRWNGALQVIGEQHDHDHGSHEEYHDFLYDARLTMSLST